MLVFGRGAEVQIDIAEVNGPILYNVDHPNAVVSEPQPYHI
jgi:hypothetical protein